MVKAISITIDYPIRAEGIGEVTQVIVNGMQLVGLLCV